MDDRYQYQSWPVKLWRRRWYLFIPVQALRMWWRDRARHLPWRFHWSVAIGMADWHMRWLYRPEEEFMEEHRELMEDLVTPRPESIPREDTDKAGESGSVGSK